MFSYLISELHLICCPVSEVLEEAQELEEDLALTAELAEVECLVAGFQDW